MTYYGASELARSFRTVRRNTLTIAEEIPAEQYGFRATADTRSVAEILAHITAVTRGAHDLHAVQRIQTYVGMDFGALTRQRQDIEKQLATRPQLLGALRADGEAWASYLDRVTEDDLAHALAFSEPIEPRTKSRFELILAVKEHEMHHRAQLMVIQRMLGLVPHLTRERLARTAPAPRPAS
jgi:uncharacterized damage-inducible protein DinB